MKKGKLVSALPPRSSRYDAQPEYQHDWDASARKALEHPGQPVLAAEHVPMTRIASLRMRRRPPFFDEDGNRAVTIHMRNSAVELDESKGKVIRFGDVYLLAPKPEGEQDDD